MRSTDLVAFMADSQIKAAPRARFCDGERIGARIVMGQIILGRLGECRAYCAQLLVAAHSFNPEIGADLGSLMPEIFHLDVLDPSVFVRLFLGVKERTDTF